MGCTGQVGARARSAQALGEFTGPEAPGLIGKRPVAPFTDE